MSDSTLDIQEQIARIQRAQEKTNKFVAEQHKLIAEAAKYRREPWVALVTGTAALLAAGAAIGGLLVKTYGG